MTIPAAVAIGAVGNKMSKEITGSDDVSVGRTVVAAGSGAALGGVAAGTLVIGSAALGVAAAPITVPLAVAGAVMAGIFSLFD